MAATRPNDMQQYLIDEFVEEYQEGHLTRRQTLRQLTLIIGSGAAAASILAACGTPAASPTAAPTAAAKPTEAPKPAATAPAAAATTAPTSAPAAATKPAAASSAATTAPAAGGTAATGSPAAAAKPTPNPVTIQPTDPAITGAGMVEINGPASKIYGYQVRPAGAGPYPTVIVIHENRGLTEHIQDVTRRAAKAGYIAFGVDLLSRVGGTAKFPEPQQVTGAIGQLTPDGVVADLKAVITHLHGLDGAVKDKLGVTGYCWGGGSTWRIASQSADVKAAVPFYGSAPPPEEIKTIKAAVLGVYGGTDERLNAGIPAAEAALKEAGVTYEIKIYPGAGHAFHNDTDPVRYNAEAAKDAWSQTIAWFDKYLKA